MKYKRWLELEQNIDETLTEEELAEGWHWCCEFDYLLVGPGMSEIEYCLCEAEAIKKAKQAYLAYQAACPYQHSADLSVCTKCGWIPE